MKKNILHVLVLSLGLGFVSTAYSDILTLAPTSFLEHMRTGTLTVTDTMLKSDLGQEFELKHVWSNSAEYFNSEIYKVLGTETLGLCEDNSKADFIEVKHDGALLVYQNRVNEVTGKEYIALCNDYFYEVAGKD